LWIYKIDFSLTNGGHAFVAENNADSFELLQASNGFQISITCSFNSL